MARRWLVGAALGSGLIWPAAAHADVFWSPGITVGGMGMGAVPDAGPMHGPSVGLEVTVNAGDYRDLFEEPIVGGLVQLEFDLSGNTRLNVGGQMLWGPVGSELAASFVFGPEGVDVGAMIAPFLGLGYVNMAGRLFFFEEGTSYGGAVSIKAPMDEDGLLFPTIASGRPLRDAHGAPLRPAVMVLGRRDAADLPADVRGPLGRAWLRDARDEHAAVDAFERLAGHLRARGAPRSLVRRARRAAADERRHARACLDVAGRLLGLELALVSRRPAPAPTPDVATLAVESRQDGRVAEGAAARIAARGARMAIEPTAARTLGAIAREEAQHAALAVDIERWAVDRGGRTVRAALQATPEAPVETVDLGPAAPHGHGAAWRRWGRPGLDARRDAWAAASRQA